jgi:DNA-binding MarR family transcriptional regulator
VKPIKQVEQEIAELFCKLPLFIDALIRGFEPEASIKLNLTEGRTLINIYLQPDEPMGVYGKQAGLSKGAFTFVADSLERKGLIKRVPVKGDRRVSSLVLTESGLATATAMDTELKDFIARKVSHLEPARIQALCDAMRILLNSADLIRNER